MIFWDDIYTFTQASILDNSISGKWKLSKLMCYSLLIPERQQTAKRREREYVGGGCDRQCQQDVSCFRWHFFLTHHRFSPAFILLRVCRAFSLVLHIRMATAWYRAHMEHLLSRPKPLRLDKILTESMYSYSRLLPLFLALPLAPFFI